MKTCVIAIGRRENLYAREFIEHYKNLGFDNVIILDNNYGDEEHFEEVLQDYVESGFVIIENYRDQIKPQMRGYTEIYRKYGSQYDWIAFFDFDEFLVFQKSNNISDYLSTFPDDCQAVLINWLCMTDSNHITYEPKPLMERFTEAMPIDRCVQYSFPENAHVKSIIRGGQDVKFGGNPHVTDTPLIAYNASGVRCENRPWQNIDYRMAALKHFTTKSAEEYCAKLLRGTPDRPYDVFLKTYVGRFFKYNQRTDEKVKFFEEHGYSGV